MINSTASSINDLSEFSIELLNYFPPDEEIEFEELTWNISDDAQLSDGGIDLINKTYFECAKKVYPL